MKPTVTDELLACIVQLNADIEEISEILEYIKPVRERLNRILESLQKEGVSA